MTGGVGMEVGDLIALQFQGLAGLQHGGVFHGGGDDVLALVAAMVDGQLNGPVVPFRAAGGEVDLVGLAAQGGGYHRPVVGHLFGGPDAQVVEGGGVAKVLGHHPQSGLGGLGQHPGGGGVVQINGVHRKNPLSGWYVKNPFYSNEAREECQGSFLVR